MKKLKTFWRNQDDMRKFFLFVAFISFIGMLVFGYQLYKISYGSH